MQAWHSLTVAQTEEKLNTSAQNGLSRKQAEDKIESDIRDGKKNRAPLYLKKPRRLLYYIFSPFASITYILYLAVAIFAFFKGEVFFGAWAIILLLSQGILLGVLNLRSVRAKQKTDLYSNPTVKVLRSGALKHTDSRNIAEGDVIIFSAGDIITCDARIIEACELVVDEFVFDTSDGKLIRRRVAKKPEKIYGSDTSVPMSDAQNIVLAGSVVISGSGRAIVVASAEDTLLSEHLNDGEMSGDTPRPLGISRLMSVVGKVSIFASLFILTVAVLGMFTLQQFDFYAIFLMAISSLLYISPTLVDVCGKFIFKSSADKLCKGTVIKKNKAFDMLTVVSDVLLLGRAGITDGELHPSSLFVSGRKLDNHIIETKPDRTHRLCEYIYTYLKVAQNGSIPQIDPYKKSLDSFITQMGYDKEGADLRLGSLYYLEDEDSMGAACAQSSGANIRIILALDEGVLCTCRYMSVGDMTVEIDENLRNRILGYIDECADAGEKLVFVLSEEIGESYRKGRNTVLEGIIAFEEHTVDRLGETLEQYREMGISVTALMADESAENIKYLAQSGLISSAADTKIAFGSHFRQNNIDITTGFGKYRAYLGFDMSEYSALIGFMRAEGRVVVSYGVEDRFNSLMTLTDTSVTCNNIEYDSEKYKDSFFESFSDEGEETSHISSQRSRVAADMLVERSGQSSGLERILNASDIASSAYINLSYYIKYLVLQMALVTTLVLLSALSGFVLINPLQISALYFAACILGLYCFANNLPKREILRQSKRGFIALPEALIKSSLPHVLARGISVILFFATALILTLCGVISKEGIAFSGFASVFVIGIIDMLSTGREYSENNSKKAKLKLLVLISAGIVALILASSAGLYIVDIITKGEYKGMLSLPNNIIGELYGGIFDVWSLILIPIFIVICLVIDFICDRISLRLNAKMRISK